MADGPLIVPTLLASGTLHFATIQSTGTTQDVIDSLLLQQEVASEILGDLEQYGWALQRVRKEPNGRQWEEEELEELGNGTASQIMQL